MKNIPLKYRYGGAWLAMLLASVSGNGHADLLGEKPPPRLNLPTWGAPAAHALSTTEERLLGRELLRQVRRTQPIIEDPELSAWLRTLGQRLTQHADGGHAYHFLIVNDPAINAYALPGGVVVVHTGLILQTHSESELAAVLAHEIAHISQRHIPRILAEQGNDPWLLGLGMLAGAAAARQNPEAAQAVITGTLAAQAHRQLAFSRQMEAEADRTGLRILAAAGFDPQGMPQFMEKLERRSAAANSELTQYLRSHPLGIDRLSDTQAQAQQLPSPPRQDDPAYAFAREKLRGLVAPNATPAQATDPALVQYISALRHLRNGDAAGAVEALGGQPAQLAAKLLLAEAYNTSKRYPDAIRLLTPVQAQAGEAGAILLAEAFMAQGQVAEAWRVIAAMPLAEHNSLPFLDVRQRVAEQAGQAVEAYRAAAERAMRLGDYRHAKATLQQASRLPGIAAPILASLQAAIREAEQAEIRRKQLD